MTGAPGNTDRLSGQNRSFADVDETETSGIRSCEDEKPEEKPLMN
ncbi:hypothetical protein OROHE_007578 [Orobanche hederae]